MRKSGLSTVALLALVTLAVSACSAASQPGADEPLGTTAAESIDTTNPGAESTRVRGPEAMFAKLDTNKDGKVTLEEVRGEAAARFAAADTNKDGFLDAAELAAMHASNRGQHDRKGMARWDKDGNGSITKAEAPPRLLAHFDEFDTNKDGILDQQELRAMRKAREEQHPGRGPGMPKMDVDGDGKVSLAEFTEMHVQMFKHVDLNGDGIVTLEELQAARPNRHAR
jgi:Ca2+-binding EF-hand superfamily protein